MYALQDGVLAGGMADGSITLWNPAKLAVANGGEASPVTTLKKHSGAVRIAQIMLVRTLLGCRLRCRVGHAASRTQAWVQQHRMRMRLDHAASRTLAWVQRHWLCWAGQFPHKNNPAVGCCGR